MYRFTESRPWRNYRKEVEKTKKTESKEQYEVNEGVRAYLSVLESEINRLEERIVMLERNNMREDDGK